MRPAVFLDRDGVINQPLVVENKPFPPRTVEEFTVIPGVAQALESLRAAGYFLCVVTNQPDVGRGTLEQSAVEAIHAHMCSLLGIDEVRVCYDDGKRINSNARKPNPGMLLEAAHQHSLDLAASYMVGDRWRDVEAGINAGCKTIFIDYQYDEALRRSPDYIVEDLAGAATVILNSAGGRDPGPR